MHLGKALVLLHWDLLYFLVRVNLSGALLRSSTIEELGHPEHAVCLEGKVKSAFLKRGCAFRQDSQEH